MPKPRSARRDEKVAHRTRTTPRIVRDADGGNVRIVGYAAVFDEPAYGEVVRPGAFSKTLADAADVRLLVNHKGVPLGRSATGRNGDGTLRLAEDDRGLAIEADLDPSNPAAAEIISALDRGDIDQMSFGFWEIDGGWSEDNSVWELREVAIDDVSVVTYPWYEATEVGFERALRAVEYGLVPTRVERAAIAVGRARGTSVTPRDAVPPTSTGRTSGAADGESVDPVGMTVATDREARDVGEGPMPGATRERIERAKALLGRD